MWTFLACPSPGGRKPVDEFVSGLGPEAENDLTAVLEHLQVLERKYWTRPQFDVLHGKKFKGMGEFRFDGENKTYRLFGYFRPGEEFVLLFGCEKKRSLKPEMEEASKRKKFAEQNERLLYAFAI
jgi:hypothetical protein